MPESLLRFAAHQEGLLSTDQCRRAGMTRQQVAARVRSKEWERPVDGVVELVSTGPDDDPDHRRRRAAVLGLLAHRGSIATGLCALVLHGVQGAPLRISPEVCLPSGAPRARRPGVRLRRSPAPRWENTDGLPRVPVAEALIQAAPTVNRRHAVAMMDSALHQQLLSRETLLAAYRCAARRRGMARTRTWWELADGRAESPAETWARLSCIDAGYPPDALQLDVAGWGGAVFARVDLAWRLPDGTALLVEIDGRGVHSAPRALYRDRARQNCLVTPRTIVRRLTGADAWHGRVGLEVARVLRPAGWTPAPLPAGTVFRIDS